MRGSIPLGREEPGAENFRDGPRLRDAAARGVRFLRVEDLAQRADAVIAQLRAEAGEHLPRAGAIARIDAQPRVDERTHDPGPHRALVVRGIAGTQVAVV